MNTQDSSFLQAAINSKLASVVAAAPIRPDWYEAWMSLGPESTEDERLKVYQSIRNAGTVPDDAGFYLVAWQIDVIASLVAEKAFREQDERLAAIERHDGLEEGDSWGPTRRPRNMRRCVISSESPGTGSTSTSFKSSASMRNSPGSSKMILRGSSGKMKTGGSISTAPIARRGWMNCLRPWPTT